MSEISKEAVAGVWPVEFGEAHITQTFPSISATGLGRLLGTAYGLPFPIGFLIHIATLPIPIGLAVVMFLFGGFRRYEVTSLRVRIRRGVGERDCPEIKLGDIDEITIAEQAGQAFYRAANLELSSQGKVALVLPGVPNPETFRQIILEARTALVQVRDCLEAQTAAAS